MGTRPPMARSPLLLLLITPLLIGAGPVAGPPPAGTFFVRGSVGIATQSLKDWNDEIESDERVLRSAGVPVRLERLGAGHPLGIEVGYALTPAVSTGVGLAWQKASSHTTYTDFSGSFATEADLSLLALVGNVAYGLPGGSGVYVAAEGGVGFGKATSDLAFRDFGNPANDVDVHGRWDGTGPLWGLAVGWERPLAAGPWIFSRVGYRHQNLGALDGRYTSPQFGTEEGPPRNNFGEAMDTDFSGFHVLVGAGYRIGAR